MSLLRSYYTVYIYSIISYTTAVQYVGVMYLYQVQTVLVASTSTTQKHLEARTACYYCVWYHSKISRGVDCLLLLCIWYHSKISRGADCLLRYCMHSTTQKHPETRTALLQRHPEARTAATDSFVNMSYN